MKNKSALRLSEPERHVKWFYFKRNYYKLSSILFASTELIFPTSATGEDTASAADYDAAVGPIAVLGSVNGIATSSFTLDLSMTTDTTVENLETVNVLLTDMAAVGSVTSDSTTTISVQILDDGNNCSFTVYAGNNRIKIVNSGNMSDP